MNISNAGYTGNGVDNRAITGVGFAPDLVIIKGNDGVMAVFKTATLTGDNTLTLTQNSGVFSDGIQSLDSDGFTLGTDARVNSNGVDYFYIAFKKAAANFYESSYTGNNTDNRNITGVGFQPDFVFIKASLRIGLFKDNNLAGDSSMYWQVSGGGANFIEALETDGFQVGDSADVNANNETFYFGAFKKVTGVFNTGTYTGNGADDRSITGAGFQPSIVIVKKKFGHASGEANGVMRTSDMGTDSCAFLGAGASNVSDGIQALQSDGFQVGTRDEVNTNGVVYHWLAWVEDSTATTTSTSTSTTTSTSTSTTSTSTSTTSTSTSTTSTSTSTTSTSTSTSTTSTSTSTTSTSSSTSTSTSTSSSTTTTLQYVYSVEEAV